MKTNIPKVLLISALASLVSIFLPWMGGPDAKMSLVGFSQAGNGYLALSAFAVVGITLTVLILTSRKIRFTLPALFIALIPVLFAVLGSSLNRRVTIHIGYYVYLAAWITLLVYRMWIKKQMKQEKKKEAIENENN